MAANGQELEMIKTQQEHLALQSMGSFFVGGKPTSQSSIALGEFTSAGNITTGQMYVQYIKPSRLKDNFSFVMVHGMTLTGKTYETTPDGRMGWYEYFARKGHAAYVVDQMGFGRSGFDQSYFNEVRSGQSEPKSQPVFIRIPDENVWSLFRIGLVDGKKFNDGKFTSTSYRELSRQSIPFKPLSKADSISNYNNLAELSSKLGNAIIISHSQSGDFPIGAALRNNSGIKGAVIIEPGFVATYSDEDIKKIAQTPILVIFGDHLDNPSKNSNFTWKLSYDGWKLFVERVAKSGGRAEMLYLPERGLKGNSHMVMQDDNNLEVADLILKWTDTIGSQHKL
ncbi:alpha/beta hydrolase family protein [Pedobacter agri]|uniref:hypothetical protein n=1 Tax=Pedobacter agri TaxID=454586 RepID=UPI0029317F98|nr:hypothetical protein [Pedobacter agri]